MKSSVIRVDTPTPCFAPENRDIFEGIITRTQTPWRKQYREGKSLRNLIAAAGRVCDECPERRQCFDVHGQDYQLGVIAGKTDEQRRAALGAA